MMGGSIGFGQVQWSEISGSTLSLTKRRYSPQRANGRRTVKRYRHGFCSLTSTVIKKAYRRQTSVLGRIRLDARRKKFWLICAHLHWRATRWQRLVYPPQLRH